MFETLNFLSIAVISNLLLPIYSFKLECYIQFELSLFKKDNFNVPAIHACYTFIENIYKGATARVHLDNQVSEPFAIERGVRQGDPLSPKLFTAVIEDIFKKADLDKGINIDGERLQNLIYT